MTLEEFMNYDGGIEDLTDLDLLPLLLKGCPPTEVLRNMLFLLRSFSIESLRSIIDIANSLPKE